MHAPRCRWRATSTLAARLPNSPRGRLTAASPASLLSPDTGCLPGFVVVPGFLWPCGRRTGTVGLVGHMHQLLVLVRDGCGLGWLGCSASSSLLRVGSDAPLARSFRTAAPRKASLPRRFSLSRPLAWPAASCCLPALPVEGAFVLLCCALGHDAVGGRCPCTSSQPAGLGASLLLSARGGSLGAEPLCVSLCTLPRWLPGLPARGGDVRRLHLVPLCLSTRRLGRLHRRSHLAPAALCRVRLRAGAGGCVAPLCAALGLSPSFPSARGGPGLDSRLVVSCCPRARPGREVVLWPWLPACFAFFRGVPWVLRCAAAGFPC